MAAKYGWKEIDDIAIDLCETHPDRDPLSVRFTELRALVEGLEDFQADPDHQVNEQILEAIQVAWHEEKQGLERDDDDEPRYTPPRPFRPNE